MAERTVFQKIWDGDIQAQEIFRSEEHGIMAILDAYPTTRGHVVVIPREPTHELIDMPDKRLYQVRKVVKTVGEQVMQKLSPIRPVFLTSGYGVPHYHEHIIPSYERRDAAPVFDPNRVGGEINTAELEAVREILEFPPNLVEETYQELAYIGKVF